MAFIEITEELKAMLLFSGIGSAIGIVSVFFAVAALLKLAAGAMVFAGSRKWAIEHFKKDGEWLTQNTLMPFIFLWLLLWVIGINV